MKKVHLVCNAHLDPVWQWDWPEGLGAALATFKIAADFCDDYDGFVFNHNEALLYEWVEQYDPALFARIRKMVAEGKWNITGGWYLQPDCNMPSGESVIRQIVTGRRYFKEKFNVDIHVAMNVDSFGHSRGLVQILHKAGYTGYIMMRPDYGTGLLDELPQSFCWQGYDDSRIIGYRLNSPYNTLMGNSAVDIAAYIDRYSEESEDICRFWGIGNHGGGPSRKDMEDIGRLMSSREDCTILHSTPEAYIDNLDRDTLPVFDRDLNPLDAGCYTSMKRMKKHYRRLESKLAVAEKAAVMAEVIGDYTYPVPDLQSACKDLLFCQFHDILPGTCVKTSECESVQKLNHGLEIADKIIVGAFYALALRQRPAQPGDIPLLVLNPHPYPITGIFEGEFMLADQNWDPTYVCGTVYEGETPLPTQMEKEKSSMNLDWRKKVAFYATLQPLSVNRFDCHLQTLPERPSVICDLTVKDEYIFQNNDMTCVLDTGTGWLKSWIVNGEEFAGAEFGRLDVYHDTCDPWLINGKEISEFQDSFHLLGRRESAKLAGCERESVSPIRIVEDGDVRTCVEVLVGWDASQARLLYSFSKHSAEIELEYTIWWNQKDTMLRAHFSHDMQNPVYTGQDMFGIKPLKTDYEMVAQQWTVVSDGTRSMGVINDCCYGSRLTEDSINPSMLRAPTYTCHQIDNRPLLPLERVYDRMDQGEHQFRFTLTAGSAEQVADTVDLLAQTRNEAPLVISSFPYGDCAQLPTGLLVEGARLDALKKSEDGQAYILRLYNYHNRVSVVRLQWDAWKLDQHITFGPMEVKTVRACRGECREVDMISET